MIPSPRSSVRAAGRLQVWLALLTGVALGASLLATTWMLMQGDGLAARITGGFALAPLILLPLL